MSTSTKSWFTTDGTYGNESDLTVIDTANWTTNDWHDVEACSDAERLELALSIAKKRQAND
jgi:hypothetical protein